MNKHLRVALEAYLDQAAVNEFPSFVRRKFSSKFLANFSQSPLRVYCKTSGDAIYFISVVPVKASESRFFAEIGWFQSGGAVDLPVMTVEYARQLDSIRSDCFNWGQREFAIRLFYLCERGGSERFWDLYLTESWQSDKETHEEFASRTAFCANDEALRVAMAGGVDSLYANTQAALVGADLVSCLVCFGVPFLFRAEKEKLHNHGRNSHDSGHPQP